MALWCVSFTHDVCLLSSYMLCTVNQADIRYNNDTVIVGDWMMLLIAHA